MKLPSLSRTLHNAAAGMGWLELLLLLAVVGLLGQVFPGAATAVFSWLDIRQWSQLTWMLLNLFVVLLLVGVRFGPEIREKHAEMARQRARAAARKREKRERERKKQELKEQRKMLERIKEGRKRRVW